MELFTIIYSFMALHLKLRGATKEVFAVIYGFWQSKKEPVVISNTIIHAITGLSHAAIANAKNILVQRKLILIHEIRGMPSKYEVILPEDESIQWTGQQIEDKSSIIKTGPKTKPQKENINKVKNNNHGNKNRSIAIGNQTEFEVPDQY